jgi:hypothetical protein
MTHRDAQRRPPAELCQHALDVLGDALQRPPGELKAEVDDAERAVVRLRDELIERYRANPEPRTRSSLDKVNAALSVIVGLEYPMGGIQRKMLEQAESALRDALNEGHT